MEGSADSKPTKDKTVTCLAAFLFVLVVTPGSPGSPHQIKQLTWQVLSQTGEVVWETSQQHALGTWWPALNPDFCQLAAGLDTWDIPTVDLAQLNRTFHGIQMQQMTAPGCSSPTARCRLAQSDFYVCPKDGRNRAHAARCGGYEEFFCASWGCETTGEAYWRPSSSWDLIKVQRGYIQPDSGSNTCYQTQGIKGQTQGLSLPLKIIFTEKGKRFTDWGIGRTWGLRWYLTGSDTGLTFKVKLKIEDISSTPVGPNPVLPGQRAPGVIPRHPPIIVTPSPLVGSNHNQTPTYPGTGDRLLNLVKGAYKELNTTSPERAKNCWLCLNPNPPYYEGIAFVSNFSNLTSPSAACKGSDHSLTLSQVTGTGLCLGNPPPYLRSKLCNVTLPLSAGSHYLVAPNGTYWACSTGLTPCVSTTVMNKTRDYCVLVQLWPRITYHTDDVILGHYEWNVLRARSKREPTTLITLAMLLGIGGIATGAGLGATALKETRQQEALQQAMTEDLRVAEKAIRDLKDSVASLSEVVLQNRRGLDLLFLKEGGLCAALKEECCFYVDKTGLVTESLDKLKERLDKRKREFESRQSWYEGIFNRSPWFTTLVSSLAGPLIILLLLLTFGPCIINKLLQFIKDRLSVVQTMVLTQRYNASKQGDSYL